MSTCLSANTPVCLLEDKHTEFDCRMFTGYFGFCSRCDLPVRRHSGLILGLFSQYKLTLFLFEMFVC